MKKEKTKTRANSQEILDMGITFSINWFDHKLFLHLLYESVKKGLIKKKSLRQFSDHLMDTSFLKRMRFISSVPPWSSLDMTGDCGTRAEIL
jgi:hypothetical protein